MKRRQFVITILTVALSGTALAQPALTPPDSTLAMRLDDEALVTRGEIGEGTRIGGILSASVLGFGAGQAVEGRWHDTGWIFTLGETASAGALIGGLAGAFSQCPWFGGERTASCKLANGAAIGGLIAWGAFRVAGIADAAIAPSIHNRHVRDARRRLSHAPNVQLAPYVATTPQGEIGGIALAF